MKNSSFPPSFIFLFFYFLFLFIVSFLDFIKETLPFIKRHNLNKYIFDLINFSLKKMFNFIIGGYRIMEDKTQEIC